MAEAAAPSVKPLAADELPILREDRDLIIENKPSGLPVTAGSGVAFGLIERLRASRPECKFLELRIGLTETLPEC